MAQINKPTDYFNTKLYTGTTNAQSITGVGFQPDMTWIKVRSSSAYHVIQDAVRGATGTANYSMISTSAASDVSDAITSFNSDGFSLGTDANDRSNYNGQTHVAWNWKANGSGSSNTDGSITSSVSANTTSGFSIVKFTGTGANATVGHGLGVAPSMIIVKNLNITSQWWVYHKSISPTKSLNLNATDAELTVSVIWNNTAATSSVFSVGTGNEVNGSGNNMIAYCFAEKTGYSKVGSYVGNNNSDGTFVYTGFKPAFIIMKSTASGENWTIYDNKRAPSNPSNVRIYANLNNAESSSTDLDLLSNGFKLRTAGGNSNDGTLIYMAFAENPLVGTNNIPAVAR